MRKKILIPAVLALLTLGVGATKVHVHYDGVPLQWKGYCEIRMHVGKSDLVVRYWDMDVVAGFSRGDRIGEQFYEDCIDARPGS